MVGAQAMRAEIRAQGSHMLAVFPSSTDTPMLAGIGGDKQPPEAVALGLLDALEAGAEEVSIGAHSREIEALARRDRKAVECEFAAFLPGTPAILD